MHKKRSRLVIGFAVASLMASFAGVPVASADEPRPRVATNSTVQAEPNTLNRAITTIGLLPVNCDYRTPTIMVLVQNGDEREYILVTDDSSGEAVDTAELGTSEYAYLIDSTPMVPGETRTVGIYGDQPNFPDNAFLVGPLTMPQVCPTSSETTSGERGIDLDHYTEVLSTNGLAALN